MLRNGRVVPSSFKFGCLSFPLVHPASRQTATRTCGVHLDSMLCHSINTACIAIVALVTHNGDQSTSERETHLRQHPSTTSA